MGNKKLIKKIEALGFKRSKTKTHLWYVTVKKEQIAFNVALRLVFLEESEKALCPLESTFPQMLAAIEEHTGVDLTPKKTKREEIEELNKRVRALAEENGSQAEMILENTTLCMTLKDAIKSQNDVIEGLKGCINPSKHKYFFGVDYGNTSDCNAISCAMLKGAENLQEDEANKEKKAFEVGDKVVLKYWNFFNKRTLSWIKEKKVFTIHSFRESGVVLSLNGNIISYELGETLDFCIFGTAFLEHAPSAPKEKALEFGDLAEVLKGTTFIKKGEKVLIASVREDAAYCYANKGNNDWIEKEHLKPL